MVNSNYEIEMVSLKDSLVILEKERKEIANQNHRLY